MPVTKLKMEGDTFTLSGFQNHLFSEPAIAKKAIN